MLVVFYNNLSSDSTLLKPKTSFKKEGERTVFVCQAKQVIQWTFNYDFIKLNLKVSLDCNDTVLTINDTRRMHIGFYECVGVSEKHGIFRAVSRLTVRG